MKQMTTKRVICSFAYIICSYVLCFFGVSSSTEAGFNFLTIISFLLLTLFLLNRTEKIVSFTTFFVVFLYAYNCGQVWLRFFDYGFEKSSFLITEYSLSSINSALAYFLIIMSFFQLFLLVFEGNNTVAKNEESKGNSNNPTPDNALRMVTGIAYLLCLFVITYNDIRQIVSAMLVGYGDSYKLGRNNPLIYMMLNLFPLLVCIGMLVFDGRKRKFITMHAIARSLIMMLLVGNRGAHIALMCVIFIAQSIAPPKKHLLRTVIFGLFLIIVAGYVADMRNLTSGRIGIAEYLRSSNIICSVLQELGGTMVDTVLLVKSVPQKLNWGYGVSYIGAFIQFIPKLSSFFPELCKYNSIGDLLNNGIFEKGSGMGGSFIGELYLNFGWFAILVLPFFAKIVNAIEKNIRSNNGSPLKKGISLYFAYAFFMYVRGNFSEFAVYARYLCYFLIVYAICKNYVEKRRIYSEKGQPVG